MKITLVSDLHGKLPAIAPCDLLIIAGDICPVWDHRVDYQLRWLSSEFKPWLKLQNVGHTIATWGNHDWVGVKAPERVDQDIPWTMLSDQACEFGGLKFYGSPWQTYFGGWAFNAFESALESIYAKIPMDTDVLITHGPPHGDGDTILGQTKHLGSVSLTERLQVVRPTLTVCGHIHSGHGIYDSDYGVVVNASILDENYEWGYRQQYAIFNGKELVEVDEYLPCNKAAA